MILSHVPQSLYGDSADYYQSEEHETFGYPQGCSRRRKLTNPEETHSDDCDDSVELTQLGNFDDEASDEPKTEEHEDPIEDGDDCEGTFFSTERSDCFRIFSHYLKKSSA